MATAVLERAIAVAVGGYYASEKRLVCVQAVSPCGTKVILEDAKRYSIDLSGERVYTLTTCQVESFLRRYRRIEPEAESGED